MKKGEVLGMEQDHVKIIRWLDKRPVLMISTHPMHKDTLVSTGNHNRSGAVMKPQAVIDYNKAKKGVDFGDQMSAYHSVIKKSFKWYRKVSFELLLGTTVVNAWIVYNMMNDTKLGITEFRRQLANDLVELTENVESASSTSNSRKRTHTFIKPEGPGVKKRKPCKGCYNRLCETLSSREADKKVRRIISYCADCPGKPGYCLPCFNKCHE